MQKIYRCALAVAVFVLTASPATAGELKLTINNGLVTVVADQVPVSRILSEWARVGQTKIVNGEKLMTVVSLELVDVPEKKALEIVLRSANSPQVNTLSGYIAAERAVPLAGTSAFDRIMILPFSQAPAQSAMPVTQTMPQPFVNRPMMSTSDFDDASQAMPPGVGAQHPVNTPQTLPTPGMLPQPNTPNGLPQQTTSPKPGFLPPPVPIKPPGGGGTDR